MRIKTRELRNFWHYVSVSHTKAYAAQSAFFLILGMIPCVLLLLIAVQFTPVTKTDVVMAMMRVIPKEIMQGFFVGIIDEVYTQSITVIPLTAFVAIWSSGKGVLAINAGLNWAYKCEETRNYIILRLRASLYMIGFIIITMFGLILPLFGNKIGLFLNHYFPVLEEIIELILGMKIVVSFVIMFIFAMLVYRFLPNKKNEWKKQIPGAVFMSVAWIVISEVFSVYMTLSPNFGGLYGSMAAIILVMLWMYFCMYALLVGGHINSFMEEKKTEINLTSIKDMLQ